jgi:pimeloyl-ACP methyl ester carboxylesterase
MRVSNVVGHARRVSALVLIVSALLVCPLGWLPNFSLTGANTPPWSPEVRPVSVEPGMGPNTIQYRDDVRYYLLLTGHLRADGARATEADMCEAYRLFRPSIDKSDCRLSDDDVVELRRQALEVRARFGFQVVKDTYIGRDKNLVAPHTWVDLPAALLPEASVDRTWGSSWLGPSITVELIRHRPGKYTVRSLFNTIMSEDACRYHQSPVQTISINSEEILADITLVRDPSRPDDERIRNCVSTGQIAAGHRDRVNLDTQSSAPLLKARLALYNTDKGVVGVIVIYPAGPAAPGEPGEEAFAALARSIAYSFYSENVLHFVGVRGCSKEASPGSVSVLFATNRRATAELPDDLPLPHFDDFFGSSLSNDMTIGEAAVAVPDRYDDRRKLSRVNDIPLQEARLETYYYIPRACLADPPTVQALDRLQISGLGKIGFKREDRALLFVHGYNTSFSDALFRLADFVREFDYPGLVFMFSWPSAGEATKYVVDMDRAEASEIQLETFLRAILKDTSIKQLDVVAHSMGAQPTMRAMRSVLSIFDDISRNWVDLTKSPSKEARGFGHVVFAAPDADPAVFRAKLHSVIPYAQSVTVYASSVDYAMLASRILRAGARRVGDIDADGMPFLIDGATVIDVSRASQDSLRLNHSYFSENLVILKDLKLLLGRDKLSDAVAAPHLRLPDSMKPMPEGADKPRYWRLEPPSRR